MTYIQSFGSSQVDAGHLRHVYDVTSSHKKKALYVAQVLGLLWGHNRLCRAALLCFALDHSFSLRKYFPWFLNYISG